jgi:prevent-host-death family protein
MKTIQATELKAKLSAILGDVERGEVVEITRHGKTIARLVPGDVQRKHETRRAIDDLRKLRASLPKVGITIEDILSMRHEDHRY